MKIIVTGGAGFLGSRVIRALLAAKDQGGKAGLPAFESIVSVDLAPCPVQDARVSSVTGDISDAAFARSIIDAETVGVYHLAAVLSGQSEEDFDLSMRVNVDGTRALLEAARALGMPVNPGFAAGVVQLQSAPQVMQVDGARLWVLGPRPQNLERLKKDWLKWYEKRKKKPSFGSGAQRTARAIDRAVANRSSIILLAEGGGRRILLTGDAHGDDILAAL